MNEHPNTKVSSSLLETQLTEWLRRKRRLEGPAYLLGAIGMLFFGLLVFAATALFTFVAFCIGWAGMAAGWQVVTDQSAWSFPKTGIAWLTAAFLALLFVQTARSKWWERGDIPEGVWSIYSSRDNPPSATATAVGIGRVATDILSTGPRLLYSAWLTFGKSRRRWQLNAGPSARVLAVLLNADKSVPRPLLAEQLPPALHWPNVERELHEIEGVLFLERGLTLSQELRSELNQITHAPA